MSTKLNHNNLYRVGSNYLKNEDGSIFSIDSIKLIFIMHDSFNNIEDAEKDKSEIETILK